MLAGEDQTYRGWVISAAVTDPPYGNDSNSDILKGDSLPEFPATAEKPSNFDYTSVRIAFVG